jgi:BASS family bile acid:Na+ symporter
MLIKVALPLVLAFIMFSLGLGLKRADFARVVRFPKAFAAGLCNQLLLLPLAGFLIAKAFALPPELAFGTMILAFSPGGVTTNVLTRIARGNTPLSISLTAVTSLVSIVTVPLLVVWSAGHFLGAAAPEVNILGLGVTMFLITALPVGLGMLVTRSAPGFVARAGAGISRAGVLLFVLVVVAALAKNWQVFSANIGVLGPALVLLNVVLLGLGLLTARLLGLGRADGTTIAIESGVQNGTLGIAVGTLVAVGGGMAPEVTLPPATVPSAVYGLTMHAVTLPFVFWRLRGAGTAR